MRASRLTVVLAFCVAALVGPILVPVACADPDPEHRVLAAGQLRLGHFVRNRFQRRLAEDGTGNILFRDAEFSGYAFTGTTDLDLRVQNTLSDQAIVDISNHISGQIESPNDVQGGRWTNLDNQFAVQWGVALDDETLIKTQFDLRTHQDVLFPHVGANTADLSLTLDTALGHDTALTFVFDGQSTAFGRGESNNYIEGGARVRLMEYEARRLAWEVLPSPVEFPKPRSAEPVFEYAAEVGLDRSRELFPLGPDSTIAPFAPTPLAVSPFDRQLKETVASNEHFAGLELGLRLRDSEGPPYPDFRRATAQGFYQLAFDRNLILWLEDDFAYQTYRPASPADTFADRSDNRFKAELDYFKGRSRYAVWGAWNATRMPDAQVFDFDHFELGMRSVTHFGRRYWFAGDTTWVDQVPRAITATTPERRVLTTVGRFTVDFSPLSWLAATVRSTNFEVPLFSSTFEGSYRETVEELRYFHRMGKRMALETGVRRTHRNFDVQVENERSESLVFVDSVIDL